MELQADIKEERMVQLKDIVKIYNKGKSNEFEALHGVSAEIKDGEMNAIV